MPDRNYTPADSLLWVTTLLQDTLDEALHRLLASYGTGNPDSDLVLPPALFDVWELLDDTSRLAVGECLKHGEMRRVGADLMRRRKYTTGVPTYLGGALQHPSGADPLGDEVTVQREQLRRLVDGETLQQDRMRQQERMRRLFGGGDCA